MNIPTSEFNNITALRGFNNIYFIKFFDKYMKLVRLYNTNSCKNGLTHDQEKRLIELLFLGKDKINNMLKMKYSEEQHGSYQIKSGTIKIREKTIKK